MSMTDYQYNEILNGEAGERIRREIRSLRKRKVNAFKNDTTRQSLMEAVLACEELEDKLTPQKGLTEIDPVE